MHIELKKVHKATPASGWYPPVCATCGEPVKEVPGGHGPVWVHEATGAVAGHGPEQEASS